MTPNVGAKPRIGVPYRTKKEQAIGDQSKIHRYLKAVRMAGGDPVPIPLDLSAGELKKLADTLDGVALSGSPADVDPSLFQALPHASAAAPDRDRESTDFALLEHLFAEGKPVLAICYGIQSLNVFLGGTLVQDIPSEVASNIGHDVQDEHSSPETFHEIQIEPGSRLANLANSLNGVIVNSSHHQSVLEPGRGLRVTATASDGVIEAVEGTASGHWVTAVQWHPERLVETDAFALSLFRGLTAAARKVPVRA
ncbi:MAG TPA: gamma-glutamyl-gamma-aminobutyrate hydrolase family protein [Candidatus Acidoferrales bacterium]|nr:gamma-glutamyl-gamma-aminobutyrate hydrolase family protein [Candidatus Acidoferrales bacterium]